MGLPDSHISPDLLCKTSCLSASALVTVKIVGEEPLNWSGLHRIAIRLSKHGEQTSEPDQPRSYRTSIALLGLAQPHPAGYSEAVGDICRSSEAISENPSLKGLN